MIADCKFLNFKAGGTSSNLQTLTEPKTVDSV